MVCSTAWSDDTKPNLFSCGFDRITLGWSVQPRENVKENDCANLNSSSSMYVQSSQPANTGLAGSSGAESVGKMNMGLRSNKDLMTTALKESTTNSIIACAKETSTKWNGRIDQVWPNFDRQSHDIIWLKFSNPSKFGFFTPKNEVKI